MEEGQLPVANGHAITIDDKGESMKSTQKDVGSIIVKFEEIKYKVVIKAQSMFGSLGGMFAPKESNTKEILHGITGSVLPGEVLALMGPSGSGKTTFLNIVGGRCDFPNVDGSLTFNGLPYSKALKRKLGFVTQDDTFYAHLTVRETLMYAALLRLPGTLTRTEKLQRVDDIIVDLGLQKCRNTIIGGQFLRGVSGGERKRVSIGHEILIDPSLLLLDEPTSGLDSTTALRIIELLHKIAESGRTVITTIHQPSSRLYHNFDKLLLLADGHSLFFGKAADAMPYFASVGLEPMMAVNPADFLLDLANGTTDDITVPAALDQSAGWKTMPAVEQQGLVKKYLTAQYAEQLLPHVQRAQAAVPVVAGGGGAETNALLEPRQWATSWFEQFGILWTRGIKERRHEFLSPLRIIQILAISLIVGCLWYNSKTGTQQQIQDQVGLCFFMVLFWGFFPLVSAVFTFPTERAMLAKERASDMYKLSAYFMSRTCADIPLEYLLPIGFLIIVYWMAALKASAGAFFLTLLVLFLDIAVAQGLGFLLGAAFMDVKKATTLASVLILAFMLAGGYYIQHVPGFIRWIRYLGFTWYSYRLLAKTQYSPHQTYACGTNNTQRCLVANHPAFRLLPLGGGPFGDVWPMLIMVIGYRLWAYWCLRNMKGRL